MVAPPEASKAAQQCTGHQVLDKELPPTLGEILLPHSMQAVAAAVVLTTTAAVQAVQAVAVVVLPMLLPQGLRVLPILVVAAAVATGEALVLPVVEQAVQESFLLSA